ncbi:MAG: L-histidine N(alpha)-methyltransferase, partial [Bacteroidales bacterium]|nr:L-histidine N(alpha)-methyltransferase [Bacteroidales bacterium]
MEQVLTLTDFAKDTLEGLSASPKYLSSKYFYDEQGSKIFQDIMHMPEYYLTDCELEIFKTQKQNILNEFIGQGTHFELVELGAGDGLKTKILLSHFLSQKASFKYTPIDISEEAVKNLVTNLKNEIPGLHVNGRIGDYFDLIKDFNVNGQTKKIILFLGSNIGNYNKQKSLGFLNQLKMVLNPQDQLFIGFDLKKDPGVILKAYNDPHGFTAAFNLNLLYRINRELDANFDLQNFKHHEVYDPQSGTAKSFLISRKNQEVNILSLNKTFSFEKWEPIFME